jgi:hypothetical protein
VRKTTKEEEIMRLIGAAGTVLALTLVCAIVGSAGVSSSQLDAAGARGGQQSDGKAIFRFETFGDEQLWTGVLRMHEAISTVDPATALAVGLKVDVDALPAGVVAALRAGKVDLTNPAVTIELLRLNAVVGVKGTVSDTGQLTSIGITCALCHSSVDNSFASGIGHRRDGWANTDLNVGAIVALSPALDDATKAEFRSWGPGKYDPRHHAFDGTNIIPLNSPSLPIVIPPAYGLKGVGFETYNGDGPISYWNAYVGVGQMGGHGSLSIEPEGPSGAAGQLQFRCGESRPEDLRESGAVRDVPSGIDVHRRAERPRPQRAVPARPERSRYRDGVCRAIGHRQVPYDAAAWSPAASALLPRWQRTRSAGRGRTL